MILDRKIHPKIELPQKIDFLKAESESLNNGLPFHFIDYSEQDVLRLQLIFDAGSIFQKQSLLSSSVNNLLVGGTSTKNAKEIAEYLENRGVFIDTELSADTACLTIYCINDHLEQVLPLLVELINDSTFPEDELGDYLAIKKQKFNVNSQKVGFIAKNEFTNLIYGSNHPYSNKIEKSDFEIISRTHLIRFFQKFYQGAEFEVYAAGKVNHRVKKLINQYLGSLETASHNKEILIPNNSITGKELVVEKDDSIQTAIRFGKEIINKSHKDFPNLYILNTILGGYFSSRLMSNIREDKGYTYGIGSALVNFRSTAYFVIGTEVGSEFTNQTVEEIKKELDIIVNSFVSNEELHLVKNYLIGSLMRSFDGAFSAMDRYRSLRSHGLNYDYYVNLVDQIKTSNPNILKEVARKYLNYDSLNKILVGKF